MLTKLVCKKPIKHNALIITKVLSQDGSCLKNKQYVLPCLYGASTEVLTKDS